MKHKKVISIALCCLLTITLLVTKPIKAKAEIDVRQSLIATLVISLINMGINVTTDVIEPYIVKWAINAQDYAQELLSQFDNVKETLIVGFKTLTLAKRIQSDLLRQGLKNNGSINVTVKGNTNNYITGQYTVNNDFTLNYQKNSLTINYPPNPNYKSRYLNTLIAYDVIPLKNSAAGNVRYYFPTYTHSTNNNIYTRNTYLVPIADDAQLNKWLSYINNPKYYFIQYNYWALFPTMNEQCPNNYNELGSAFNNAYYENKNNYKYLVVYNTLRGAQPPVDSTYTYTFNWTKTIPTNDSTIPIDGDKEVTVTAGTIDTANWSNINNNYTYEMIVESNNQVVTSNQALIDAIKNNTQSITQSQVIDTTTQTSVEDIKTNVWGISSLLEGIKATFQTLVKPITDVFNKTYTLEEINTLSWVNVMNELVTTIDTGVGNIIPYYQNYVGNYLQGISHPQANILTTTVNDILVNTNLSWAVYAISVILLVKGVIL